MFRCLNLLLFCFISYSGTPPVGTTPVSVTEKKGGNVTLTCESEAREISVVELNRLSENILVCEKEECKSENDRVFKEGSCDVVIKDLIYSDAGKYTLNVFYNNDQTEVKRLTLKYHLHIHDAISVKKGEDLKLDVLLINADKVERNSSEGWTEVWMRGHGVNSDRLTVSDETLIINEFTVTDTGTYRVLDYEGETLITVSVTESGSGSKGKLDTEDNTHNEQLTAVYWFWGVGLPVILLVVVGVIVFVVIKKPKCLNRLYSPPTDQNTKEPDL
ncbi:hypothetical protein PO909_003929 [Leuciscus waleckii]